MESCGKRWANRGGFVFMELRSEQGCGVERNGYMCRVDSWYQDYGAGYTTE